MASSLERPPAKVKPYCYRFNVAFFPKKIENIHTDRNLASSNRLRYYYGGHVSYDVIIRAIVIPQMGGNGYLRRRIRYQLFFAFTPCPEWVNMKFS